MLKEKGICRVELVIYNGFVILCFHTIFHLCMHSISGHFETEFSFGMTLQVDRGI